jgi:gas vesicle protein
VFSRLTGVQIPLRVTGTLDAPGIAPDLSELSSMIGQAARAEVEAEVDEAVEEVRGEVDQQVEQEQEELNQEVEQELDEAREGLRDRLRGLD